MNLNNNVTKKSLKTKKSKFLLGILTLSILTVSPLPSFIHNEENVSKSLIPIEIFHTDTASAAYTDNITITENTSSKKMIESSKLKVWVNNTGRYGMLLKPGNNQIFFGQDSAHASVFRDGASFPTTGMPSNFESLSMKSFNVTNDGTIELTKTDNVFDYTMRVKIVNATTEGAYMKMEMEAKNITSDTHTIALSFNMDTMINGNDSSPFKVIENGWDAFYNNVQVTAYYKDVFHVTNADSIYLGRYNNQIPTPINNYAVGQEIYPGDSGAGFYYNQKSVAPNESRVESWIMGLGPKNANPIFNLTNPVGGETFYTGQTLNIQGTAKDTDVGDRLAVKWAIDGGTEQILDEFVANGNTQNFSGNYDLPNTLTNGTHKLQVWVMDDKGGVSSSNTKTFIINNFMAPGSPEYENVTNNSFKLHFDKKQNVDATTYELFDINKNETKDLGHTTSIDYSNLSPNTKYSFKVRGKNTLGAYTDYSSPSSIYTLANVPSDATMDSSNSGKVILNWATNGNPESTDYVYEVRNTATNTVAKTGTVRDTHTEITLPTDIHYDVFLKAVNGDGVSTEFINLGHVFQDTIEPTASYTQTPTGWVNDDVNIDLTASDMGTGIKEIILPNGSVEKSSKVTYTVKENGTYTFKVVDNAGNILTKPITVSNIDKTAPSTPTITLSNSKWTTPVVSFTVADNGDGAGSGVAKIQYRINGGNWADYNGTAINVPSNLVGRIPVESRVFDKVGNISDISKATVLIDDKDPVINNVSINKQDDKTKELVVDAIDNESGIKDSGYKYYQQIVGKDNDLVMLKDWNENATISLPTSPSNTKYIYQAEVRDYNNHNVKSSKIAYVSAPLLTFSGVKKGGYDNTATFEFSDNVGEDVDVYVYREGEYVAKLSSGSKFVDEGLDYERDYDYEFIAKSTFEGNTVESLPEKAHIAIGKPTLEISNISENYYKTPFTDDFVVSGEGSFRKGGKVNLELYRKSDNALVSKNSLDLVPYVKSKWSVIGNQSSNAIEKYVIKLDLSGYENSDLYKREFEVNVSQKPVTIQTADYLKYFK